MISHQPEYTQRSRYLNIQLPGQVAHHRVKFGNKQKKTTQLTFYGQRSFFFCLTKLRIQLF